MQQTDEFYLKHAIALAEKGMDKHGGGPFGAVIVDENGHIIGEGFNQVTPGNDPTAHAEVVAIRNACQKLGTFQLNNCTIYASCEPCPMCLGAIYWARPKRIVFACSRQDAAFIGFDDEFLYEEIGKEIHERHIPTSQILREKGKKVFEKWAAKEDKTEY